MNNTQLQQTLDQYFARVFRSTSIRNDQDLFESGLMNSLRAMHLVLHLEKTFRIRFAPSDLKRGRFSSRGAILELLSSYVEQKDAQSGEVDMRG